MLSLTDPTSRAYARLAGLGYITIAVAGGFSIAYMPSVVFDPGIGGVLLDQIAAQRSLFLAGIGADAVVMLAELLVTAMLFFMFRPVNATLALIAALARFGMVAVMASMLMFYAGLAALAEPNLVFESFSPDQRGALAELLLYMHDSGVWVWQVLFAAHLLALGALVLGSGRFPRLLGWGMALSGMGYLLDSLYAFAFPEVAALGVARVGLLAVVTLSEVGFALWLTFRGPRPQVRHAALAAPA